MKDLFDRKPKYLQFEPSAAIVAHCRFIHPMGERKFSDVMPIL